MATAQFKSEIILEQCNKILTDIAHDREELKKKDIEAYRKKRNILLFFIPKKFRKELSDKKIIKILEKDWYTSLKWVLTYGQQEAHLSRLKQLCIGTSTVMLNDEDMKYL